MGDENRITYNGVDLRTLGLYASGDKAFKSPKKDYEKISIPGRSGDLIYWNGRYENVDVSYSVIYLPTPLYSSTDTRSPEEKYRENMRAIRGTLLSPNGYVRIEDCYNPDEYRLGVFTGPLDVDTGLLQAGKGTLTFNCRPERYLKSGDEAIEVQLGETAQTVTNPTFFPSKPILKFSHISPNQGVTIRGTRYPSYMYTITTTEEEGIDNLVIDCENERFYRIEDGAELSLYNEVIVKAFYRPREYGGAMLEDDSFITLAAGGNTITSSGSYTLTITPRWYVL